MFTCGMMIQHGMVMSVRVIDNVRVGGVVKPVVGVVPQPVVLVLDGDPQRSVGRNRAGI